MNAKRAAAIVVVGGALAVWLAAAATSGSRDAVEPRVVTPRPTDHHADLLASEIDKLHEHLRPSAGRLQPGRNLFSFASRQPRSAPPAPVGEGPALSEPAPAVPRAPSLKLVGIAENNAGTGVVRTAILSGAGELLLVKEGDNATPRYRVSRISTDVVELSDLIEGTALRLALK